MIDISFVVGFIVGCCVTTIVCAVLALRATRDPQGG